MSRCTVLHRVSLQVLVVGRVDSVEPSRYVTGSSVNGNIDSDVSTTCVRPSVNFVKVFKLFQLLILIYLNEYGSL